MEAFEKIQLSFKCPKTLDTLKPCQDNWYCDGCKQMVYDFRGMTEDAILKTFTDSGQKLCGIYDADRIKVLPQQPRWLNWISAAMMLISVVILKNSANAQKITHSLDKQLNTSKTDSINSSYVGFVAIEIFAEFPGGEDAFLKYLFKYIKNSNGFKGKAFVQFIVERNGSLTNIKIIRSAGKVLDDQLVEALKKSPKWKPAINNGRVQRTSYTLPVDFSKSQVNTSNQ